MVDVPCLPKKDPIKEESIEYFKASTLSIFCLFNLTRQDTSDVIACLEYIDTSYSQTIDVVAFADAFCPNGKAAFVSLWKKYHSVVCLAQAYESALTPAINKYISKSKSRRGMKSTASFEDIPRAKYVPFISYLFFIASVEKKHCARWLYWLWFTMCKEVPTKNGLVDMSDALWGDTSVQGAKYHKFVKASVRFMELGDFNFTKFRVYDWKSSGAFTLPFVTMQRDLLRNIGTRAMWKRIISSVLQVAATPDLAITRVKDVPVPRGSVSHRNLGDRKTAKEELNRFFQAFNDFHEFNRKENAQIVQNDRFAIIKDKCSAFLISAKQYMSKYTQPKVYPGGTSTGKQDQESDAGSTVDNNTTVDDFSLVHKYRKVLKWSPEKLYMKAELERNYVEKLLEEVKDDLDNYVMPDIEDTGGGLNYLTDGIGKLLRQESGMSSYSAISGASAMSGSFSRSYSKGSDDSDVDK